MPVSTVKVSGKNYRTPGAYSEIDTSAAVGAGLLDGGTVGVVGDGKNGKPQSVLNYSSLASLLKAFSEPDGGTTIGIRTAAKVLYDAVGDPAQIKGKPTSVLAVKANQDTQGTAVLQGSAGALIDLTSVDYGAHVNKINISIAAGTIGGVAVTVKYLSTIETQDNLGNTSSAKIKYTGTQATTAKVDVSASALDVKYTLSQTGKGGAGQEIVSWVAGKKARVESSDAADTYQKVTVYGLDAGDAPVSEVISLNGTNKITGTQAFKSISGIHMDYLALGAITLTTEDDVTIRATIAAGLSAAVSPTGVLKAQSDNASDAGKIVQFVGHDGNDALITDTCVLVTGSDASTTKQFKRLLRVSCLSTTVGTITVKDTTPTTLLTMAPSATKPPSAGYAEQRGLLLIDDIPQAAKISLDSAPGTPNLIIRGFDSSNVAVTEKLAAAPATTTAVFSSITHIEYGHIDSGDTVVISGKMVAITDMTQTVDDLATFLLDLGVFSATVNDADRILSDLDYGTNIEAKTSDAELTSYAADVIDWINAESELVTAVRRSGASGAPLLTAQPTFLAGGTSIASTVSDYQAAIDLLKQHELDFIVVLSTNDAVHAYLKTHIDAMNGAGGKKERQGFVGLASALSKADQKTKAAAIGSQYMAVITQDWIRYDEAGVKRTWSPVMGAVCACGMMASSPIGTPLTRKYVNVLDLVTTGWNPTDDGEEILQSGIMFAEKVAVGVRWVRSNSSYIKTANRVWTEMSTAESLLKSVKDLRTFLDDNLIGEPTTRTDLLTVKALAEGRLQEQVVDDLIVDWGKVTVTQVSDLTTVEYEVAPVEPRNFVKLVAHATLFSAAA